MISLPAGRDEVPGLLRSARCPAGSDSQSGGWRRALSRSRCLGLLATAWLGGCMLFSGELVAPQVSFQSIRMEQVALERQTFRVRVRLENPNHVTLKVRDAQVFLDLDGSRVGRGLLLQPVSVPARGSEEVDLRITTDLAAQGPRLWQWLLAGTTTISYRVSGFVDPGNLGIGRLELDERGSVSLADLAGVARRYGGVEPL